MLFCNWCGNLLIAEDTGANVRFYCRTCPYVHDVDHRIMKTIPLDRKQVDDILGGADAWKNVDQTDATCPSCSYHRAYFMQIQLRSADEPMTTFLKCVSCGHRWSD
eukprot:gb/GECG01008895.1/.p1 GENE.gb/GECG01008895.1/~~gb/GECG01008895.1/.p1  ORF type:complete len:106 (+),score=5.76 gb/GECG01008895.1/:1-318(+)